MDSLLQKQNQNKVLIFNFLTNYNKTGITKRTYGFITGRIELLNRYFNEFQELHSQIISSVSPTATSNEVLESYILDDVFSSVECEYAETLGVLKDALQLAAPSTSQCTTTPLTTSNISQPIQIIQSYSMPQITIPKFNGNLLDWPSFKDLFTALVINNKNLTNVQRLQYLKTNLSGEADNLLRDIMVTDDNFVVAWECLTNHYENQRILVNTYINSIMNAPKLNRESCSDLKLLLSTITQSVRALTNLKRPVEHWDDWLIYVTVHKFDSITRKDWETKISIDNNMPTFQMLTDFMTSRISTLTAIQYDNPSKSSNNNVKSHHSESSTTTSSNKCPCCSHKHPLSRCFAFRKKSPAERKVIVSNAKLCTNCFCRSHSTNQCSSLNNCRVCNQRHHSLLHIGDAKSVQGVESSSSPSSTFQPTSQSVNSNIARNLSCQHVLLATAIVNVQSSDGGIVSLKALLDQGSHASFITQSAVQLLRLRPTKINVSVSGIGATSAGQARSMVTVNFSSRYNQTEIFTTEALVLNKLTSQLPQQTFNPIDLPFIENVELADPDYHRSSKIDIILGANIYSLLLRNGLRTSGKNIPVAQNTALGWILSGPIPNSSASITAHHTFFDAEFGHQLRKFWEVEEVNAPTTLDPEDHACEQHFINTHQRNSDGRYIVRLPIKHDENFVNFGDTRKAAVSRLYHIEQRFQRNQELKQQYSEFMSSYESLGHMQPIHSSSNNYNGYFIPHHCVFKESSTSTKLRVVFDASRRGPAGFSLNDRLYIGPKLQNDLASIVLRWRIHAVVIISDIEKMFRQILIHPDDTKFQRIVWRNSINEPIQNFELMTVTYGTSCAPYLANRTLQQLAIDEENNFPLASKSVFEDCYVDDILTGADDIQTCLQLQSELINMFSSAGFVLKKWSSNSRHLLSHLPEDMRESKSFEIVDDASIKALGVHWTPSSDHFGFKVSLGPAQVPTSKRSLLSDVSKLYDPLGWVSPVIVTGKIMFQHLWLLKSTWDDVLPPELQHRWNLYRAELQQLNNVQLPRFIDINQNNKSLQLHGFADASTVAYAAVVYLRVVLHDGSIVTHLLSAKTKVAPIKQLTIARLELLAAALLSKLILRIKKLMHFENVPTFGWSDSTTVLAWLRSPASRWKVFIANRVSTIQHDASIQCWNYVSSTQNAADCASRGLMPNEILSHSLWWHGPQFLRNEATDWTTTTSIDYLTTLEEKSTVVANLVNSTPNDFVDVFCKYSSLHKLIRIVAYCRRFIYNVRNSGNRMVEILTTNELSDAEIICIHIVQNAAFYREIFQLKHHHHVAAKSSILKLSPFIDERGTLRVGGRLQNSLREFLNKHPIILPRDGHFTQLIIASAHSLVLHGGAQLTLNYLREKYWIIDGRNKVRQYIRRCISCFKYASQPSQQLMGQLPSHRVTPARAFLHAGVDYAGPIDVRTSKGRGNKSYKAYIAIFVCFATRAVHLELVSDQTSTAFIAAFHRFVSRRGICSDLYSDCGSNFVGANSLLLADIIAAKKGTANEIIDQLSTNGTQWHFIPPGAPHHGGIWESAVKSTKHHLKRVIGQTKLTFEEMYTFLCQVEACLNSRPLYPLSDDPQDMSALTPGHFLIGTSLCSVPMPNILNINVNRLSRWQLVQQMQQHFWSRWSNEYLNVLQQRSKWSKICVNLKIGDMVLVKDDRYPPCSWPLGRIIDIHPGSDGLVRVVSVKCKSTILKRSITKICALPIDNKASI